MVKTFVTAVRAKITDTTQARAHAKTRDLHSDTHALNPPTSDAQVSVITKYYSATFSGVRWACVGVHVCVLEICIKPLSNTKLQRLKIMSA